MDSQGSQHSQMTIRPMMATSLSQVPLSLSTQPTMFAPNIGPSYLTTGDIMMYAPATGQIVINNSINQCLITQAACRCALGVPSSSCAIHQNRSAFGQASSNVAATHVHTSSQQTTSNSVQPRDDSSSSVRTFTSPAVPRHDSISLAREATTLGGIRRPLRTQCRLKRGPTGSNRAGIDSANIRAPKLRRVASEGSSDNQNTATDESRQETSAPQSTSSQLVTGPVPTGNQACSTCGPGQRCTACTPSVCPLCPPICPVLQSYVSHLSHPQGLQIFNVHASGQTMSVPHHHHPQQQVTINSSLQMVQDALLTSQVQQSYLQQEIYRPAALLQQQQLMSRFYPTTIVPVPVPIDFLILPQDMIDPRANVIDRHHMFAAQIPIHTEPQPIGLNNEDIEKYSQKVHFVTDNEVPESEQERCTVCQCEFENGEEIRHLLCTHQFHVGCIDRWLNYNKKCPVCRVDIDQHQKPVLVE